MSVPAVSPTPTDDLFATPPFPVLPGPEFIRAVAYCLATLRARIPRYADFLARHGVRSEAITTLEQVDHLPSLFLPVLKTVPIPFPAGLDCVVRLTSSGTSGKPSVVPADADDWRRRVQAMAATYEALGLFNGGGQALAFLLDPQTTQMAGSLVIDAVLRQVPSVPSVTYLARQGSAGPEFSFADAAAALQTAVRNGPVVLVGYPALIAAAIEGLLRCGTARLPLPSGSLILTGGGWKSFLPGVSLDQDEFRRRASAFFDLPADRVRDMYGLSECPAVFVQCESGRYHVPGWVRAPGRSTRKTAPTRRPAPSACCS